ncbi:hypothetical protein D3C79_839200 [compost metagenome]
MLLQGFTGAAFVFRGEIELTQGQATALQQMRHANAGLTQLPQLVLALELAQQVVELGVGTGLEQTILGKVQNLVILYFGQCRPEVCRIHQLRILAAHCLIPWATLPTPLANANKPAKNRQLIKIQVRLSGRRTEST